MQDNEFESKLDDLNALLRLLRQIGDKGQRKRMVKDIRYLLNELVN